MKTIGAMVEKLRHTPSLLGEITQNKTAADATLFPLCSTKNFLPSPAATSPSSANGSWEEIFDRRTIQSLWAHDIRERTEPG